MSRPNYLKTTKSNTGGGIGIYGVLQIIFIVLKLLKLINWSWWLVFIPTFISIGITLLAVFVGLAVCLTTRKQD